MTVESPDPRLDPVERRAVFSLAGLYSFRMLGLFMLLPVLALYGRDYAGSSPFLLGVALGAYGLSQALLQIPFGVLSDRIGRKPVIAGGLVLFALGSVVAAQAETVYELIAGRALQGAGAIASAIMALVADLTTEENRTKAMAVIGMSIGVSFSLALVLGPVVSRFGGLEAIFWLTALFALVGLVMLLKLVPTPHRTRVHRDAGTVPQLFWQTLRNVELQRLNLGIFALHFALMASFVVLPVVLEDQLGVQRDQHWLVYLPLLVLAFLAMVPFIIVAERKRQMKPVFVAAIGLLAAMELALVFWQHSLPLTLTALFLFFMAFNLLEACLPSLVSKVAPAGSKGTAAGIYSTSQFLGAFAGGVIGGWWIQSGVPADVFIGSAVVVLVWGLVAAYMHPPRYLSSILVSVGENDDLDDAETRLRELTGVEEVMLIEEERVAYLKVDSQRFDRNDLRAIGLV